MNHICTQETFMQGAIEIEMICPICELKIMQRIGYIDAQCSNCKQYYSGDEWMGSILEKRRNFIGMTRKQFANLLGIKPSTLKKYETVKCSKKIFDKSSSIVNDKNNK